MDELSVKYIVGAKLRSLPSSLVDEVLQSSYHAAVVNNEFAWVREFKHKGRRLICSYSSKRAAKDAADRNRLIDRLLKKHKNGKLKLADLIPNYGTKKYIDVKGRSARINQDKIDADAAWDGIYGIITNAHDDEATELLERYRGLWQIEDTFRLSKHELRMRPIYHWTEQRIRAHIMICFIALAVARHATYRLAVQQNMPMSFEQLRNELLHAQSSLLVDISTKKKFLLPSKVTMKQMKIYQVFGLKRTGVVRPVK
jgi:transposase